MKELIPQSSFSLMALITSSSDMNSRKFSLALLNANNITLASDSLDWNIRSPFKHSKESEIQTLDSTLSEGALWNDSIQSWMQLSFRGIFRSLAEERTQNSTVYHHEKGNYILKCMAYDFGGPMFKLHSPLDRQNVSVKNSIVDGLNQS